VTQICQFCYHNIKENGNGSCPACRRTYNEKDIVWKAVTPEETLAYKQRQLQKQKKSQQAIQKEKQKAEADHLSRKHLAGLRVVQKNLVYVTGLSPTSQEDQLLQTLRGDQYFGQYGKIIKIVVSKAKDPSHPQSVGVYVTYERKEDAASCIAAVNGSKNGDRVLRAQFGTTKYCSAFLRGEQCQNRQCMFLHEAGEASESYSRGELSNLNYGSSQHEGGRPPPQSQQPIAASQPMARQASGDQPHSPATDRPALPSTASWASRPVQQPSRAESRAASASNESPAMSHVTPAAQPQSEPTVQEQPPPPPVTTAPPPAPAAPKPRKARIISPLQDLIKNFDLNDFKFVFNLADFSSDDAETVKTYPPLFDENGGAKRRLRRQQEEEQRRIEQETQQQFSQPPEAPSEPQQDEAPGMSGSQQLGGEPEERGGQTVVGAIGRPQVQDSVGILDPRFQFGGVGSPAALSDRGMTPQHQQLLLNNLNPGQLGSGFGQSQPSNPPGHQRNTSRYTFANGSDSASTTVKPVANPALLKQQSAMMPQRGGFGTAQQGQFFTSNVQGPPPGLKTTGTPPVSGGMTFGQGHGFATGGLQYGAGGSSRNPNEDMMRNLLRGRDATTGALGAMDQKREFMSPPNVYNNTVYPPVSQAGYPAAAANMGYASAVFSDGEKPGQRGKKKSKKHARQGHGNTSSTSSAMDLGVVDNHLLQSRFQAAAGLGGAGAHSGLYGQNGMMHGGGSAYGGRW
jgi:CCR4-NOT transcription complex subunit 4